MEKLKGLCSKIKWKFRNFIGLLVYLLFVCVKSRKLVNKLSHYYFDRAICKAFPNLYRNRYADMRTTCMCWGFEIGKGWQLLVWNLSEKLEELILQLPEEDRKHCCASQVKSKYAGLRFYMDSATDEMYALIGKAENESESICEECGEPGTTYGYGWVTCYCPDCAAKHNLFATTREMDDAVAEKMNEAKEGES